MKNHEKSWKITVEAEREIFPPKIFFKIVFMIIPIHNLAENQETGMGNSWAVVPPCFHRVMKSLTPGAAPARVRIPPMPQATLGSSLGKTEILKIRDFSMMFMDFHGISWFSEILAWGSRSAPASSRGSGSLSEVPGGCPDIPRLLICIVNHQK